MELRVSAPGSRLEQDDLDRIERDLQKLDRRLVRYREVRAQLRIQDKESSQTQHVTLEVEFGRNHLIAKAQSENYMQAVRAVRDEIIRQINDRSRGGHSSHAKGR